MSEHRFGGPWTELKLDAIEYYLQFYTAALRYKRLNLWYVDAFAGSGERHHIVDAGDLHEGTPIAQQVEARAGSAKRAMAIEPPFRHIVLIEQDPGRRAMLDALVAGMPGGNVRVIGGDANQELRTLFTSEPWLSSITGGGYERGVVFLDPYGMNVPWTTLSLLARTQSIDLWYLFPLNAVLRQMPRDLSKIDKSKVGALNRVLGTDEWRTVHYSVSGQSDMFSDTGGSTRTADGVDVEAWFKARLEKEFAFVSEPLRLFHTRGPQLFSLFCCISNPEPRAVTAARSGLASLQKKFAPMASHRRSGR